MKLAKLSHFYQVTFRTTVVPGNSGRRFNTGSMGNHSDFLDRDVLAISQTCSEWRNYCLEENVFHHHEKETLLEFINRMITAQFSFYSNSGTKTNLNKLIQYFFVVQCRPFSGSKDRLGSFL